MDGEQNGAAEGSAALIRTPDGRSGDRRADRAPQFTLASQHGEQISVPDPSGRPVLLVFYPFAFSGICSSELTELNTQLPTIRGTGTRLLTVSVDTMYALRVFGDQYGLDSDLLSDFWPHGAVAQQFGVFDEQRGCAVRGSFLIGADGRIAWQMVNDPGTARSIDAHIQALTGSRC